MTTKAIYKRESTTMHTILCSLLNIAVFLGSFLLFSMIFVPLAIAERGCMAFGGEWFLVIGLSVIITQIFAHKK